MSKIAPCLWFEKDAEAAVDLYVSLLPNSGIEHVQRNVSQSPSGPEGSVLVIYFTLAGQKFLALNGGERIEPNHLMSLQIDCEDQAEVDRLWNAIAEDGGEPIACGWIKDRWGIHWQITPSILPKLIADPDIAKARRVMSAMMQMVKLDIAALQAAYDGEAA